MTPPAGSSLGRRSASVQTTSLPFTPSASSRVSRSRRLQAHLPEHRAAEQAVGIGQLLHDLEMVVAFHDGERDRLACRLNGGGELAVLALDPRCLGGAVDDRNRRDKSVEMALRAQLLLHLIGE